VPKRGQPGRTAEPQPAAAESGAHQSHLIDDTRLNGDRAAFVETIIDSAGSGIIVYDRDLRIKVWNPFMEDITGLSAAEVLGRPAPDVFPEVMKAGVIENLRQALAGAPLTSREFEYVIPQTGRHGSVLGTYRPHVDGSGRIVGVVASILDISARRQAEEELKRSEAQFRAIFDSVTDGITVTDAQGRFVEVNAATCRQLGYTRDEMIGMAARDVNQPQTAAAIAQNVPRLLAGETITFQGTHVRKDGTSVPTEVTARRIDFHGQPAILAVVRDLSERQRAEDAARNQARYLQQLVDAIPIPILAKNLDGTIGLANAAFAQTVGRKPDEIIGRHSSEVGIGEADVHRSHDEAIMCDGQTQRYELSVRVPAVDAERRLVFTKAPIRGPDGAIEGITTAGLDITERYETEQALKASEERFRTLFENAADAIYIADLTGRILEVNQTACRTLGYTRDELLAEGVSRRLMGDRIANLPAAIATLTLEAGRSFETVQHRKDGVEVPIEMSVSLIDLGGQPAILAIARDVSERRRLEDQVREAQKFEGIGQLAGGIAHDFNNLLTAIRGNASLALMGLPAESPAREELEQIEQASDRAAALTRQLLAFARRSELKPEVINLAAIVEKLVPMLGRLLSEDVTLIPRLASPRCSVRADPSRIEQVVVNLVVNAKDAMPEGGELTIEVADVELDEGFVREHRSATLGQNVMLAVSDTGTGMDQATIARAFDPFFTTKAPGRGTGLGLAVVHGIVRQSGGCIVAESELGRGSTFRVYLPSHTGPTDRPPLPEQPARDGGGANRRGTILLVEDEESVRNLARKVLERAGFKVVTTPTSSAAFEIDPKSIDLLLTDVVMPVISGREVADRLTARRPDLRVLFMSGHADRTIVNHGVLDPTIRYLPKPFTPRTLVEAVDAAMSGAKPEPASEVETH
jgi:two-component system cell cycle sensor histidine kinase/response regulator CckA